MKVVLESAALNYSDPTRPMLEDRVLMGQVVGEEKYEYAGTGMEPNGFITPQVRSVSEYWFHPYNGAPPVRCSHPMPNGYGLCQLSKRELDL